MQNVQDKWEFNTEVDDVMERFGKGTYERWPLFRRLCREYAGGKMSKQFTVRGSQFFLKMCPLFVSLLVSALFRWPCSISVHLSPRSVAAGVRPFPLAM